MKSEPPPGWAARALYDLGDYINGRATKPGELISDGVPVIKIAELNRGITAASDQVPAERVADRHWVRTGDLLFAWSGSVGIHVYRGDPAALNQHIFRVIAKRGIDQRFLRYLLIAQLPVFERFVASKRTTMGHVTDADLRRMRVQVPSLDEQRRIACLLGALDDKIDNNRRLATLLDAFCQAEFDYLMARAAMEQPEGWDTLPLGELADVNAVSHSARNHPNEILYVDISSTSNRRIVETRCLRYDEAPSRARRVVRTGDTLVSTVRPERRAMAFVHRAEPNLTASTGFAILTPTNGAPTFVYRAATSDACIDHLTAAANGSAYPAVNPSVLADWRVPAPADRGVAFEELARPLEAHIWALQQQSSTLAAIRDALLPQLISGQIRVSDSVNPDEVIEPAAEAVAAAAPR